MGELAVIASGYACGGVEVECAKKGKYLMVLGFFQSCGIKPQV